MGRMSQAVSTVGNDRGAIFVRRHGSAAGSFRAPDTGGLPAYSGGCVSQISSGPAILVEGLTKSFGEVRALRGIDLSVPEGTVLGVLGPNGAGKTTAVRILTTLLRADGGRAVIDGIDVAKDPRRVRTRIGLTGQYAAVDERLTGRENLELIGRFFRMSGAQARE